ncbi:hypothetical protein GOP47_0003239 [Adiantum capillus-veneris]|uniref:Uncharacterized protein n=1 Tax=Adiantum capillus-veneris TaxID=13818 RepID=A0A9D4VD59_ADICA|nr:hypothetical protein GOP47_0003239 [Adiantum capillus-veneris]
MGCSLCMRRKLQNLQARVGYEGGWLHLLLGASSADNGVDAIDHEAGALQRFWEERDGWRPSVVGSSSSKCVVRQLQQQRDGSVIISPVAPLMQSIAPTRASGPFAEKTDPTAANMSVVGYRQLI